MTNLYSTFLVLFIAVSAMAQSNKKEQDQAAIKAMCGCYEITFKYAETFRSDTAYTFHEPYATRASAEWIFVDEETDDEIVIQHILVVNDTLVIKHWRQDWLYENTTLFSYVKDHHWKKKELLEAEVQGQWTQKVYQVDDGPRYEGSATWVHEDGKHYWESTADTPLPRREYTKRADYNVMRRRNRHQITDYGWIHEQDNQKIIRRNDPDSLLVEEKGYNIYKKTDESKCEPAKAWWQKNKAYWRLVRAVWNDIFADEEYLHLKTKIDGKKRWRRLFDLQEEFTGKNTDSIKKEIRQIIALHTTDGKPSADQEKTDKNRTINDY